MNTTMDLLKLLSTPSLLIPHEPFFIQSFHKAGRLVSEQNPAENNPLIQLALDLSHEPPHLKSQSGNILHTVNTACHQTLQHRKSYNRYVQS